MQMIDVNLEKTLQRIDISDTPIEEVYLVGDFPIFNRFRFSIIFPALFFVAFIIISVFLPNPEYTQIIEDKISDSTSYVVRNTVSLIAPIYNHVFSTFYLKNLNPEQINGVNITGNLKVLCYKESTVVHNFSSNVSTRPFTDPIELFYLPVINFDKIVTNFNFTTQHKLENLKSTVLTTTQSATSTLFILFIRIFLSLIIFYYFFGDLNPFLSKNSEKEKKEAPKTLEQIFTYFLLIAAFFYANPLEIINLKYPTKFFITFPIFLRDFFYSYFAFYILALFSFFTRNPLENQLISLAFPYGYMSVSLLLLWINDADIYVNNDSQILPQTSFVFDPLNPTYQKFDDLNIFHLLYFCSLFLVSIYQIIRTGIVVNKSGIENQQRWIFYTSSTIFLLLLVSFYAILKLCFQNLIDNTVYDQCYLLLALLCYAIIMEGGHEGTDLEKKDIYEKQNEGQFMQFGDMGDDDNQLDVEDDPELLAKQEKKKQLKKEIDLATAAELNEKPDKENKAEEL